MTPCWCESAHARPCEDCLTRVRTRVVGAVYGGPLDYVHAYRRRAVVAAAEYIAAFERGRNIARHDGACTCLRCQVRRHGTIG